MIDESPLFTKNDKELIQFAHKTKNNLIMDTVAPEMMRRLKISIEKFNESSSRQTKWIIWLTIAMLITAVTQMGLLVYSLFTQA